MGVSTTTVVTSTDFKTRGPYPAAVALASFSLLSVILVFPAMIQHYHRRNIGATVLVASAISANLMVTTNALVWSNDDISNWYNGIGLCDVQVRVISMISLTFPASICCVLRALASVMDTNSATWAQTTSQRRRGRIIDLVCCVGIPALFMPLSYINQPVRIVILGIAGCQWESDRTWLGFVLNILPQLLGTLLCVYYAVLILIRLIRYRRSFNTVLANSDIPKTRFIRLYGVCILIILGQLSTNVYILVVNVSYGLGPFHWYETHNNPDLPWNSAILVPSYGTIYFDRVCWVVGAYLVFFFFGFGAEAMATYRDLLLALGLGRIFPALKKFKQSNDSITDTFRSFGSKVKILMKSENSTITRTDSIPSTIADVSSSSPKMMTFFEVTGKSREKNYQHRTDCHSTQQRQGGTFLTLTSFFSKNREHESGTPRNNIYASDAHPEHSKIVATASVTPNTLSAVYAHGQKRDLHDVLVIKEVRQASETAESLPPKLYEGV